MRPGKILGYVAREGSALALAGYALYIAYGGAQNPTDGLGAMFGVLIIFGIYVWFQDLGAALDNQLNPGRALVEIVASSIPLLVAGYALLQDMRGIEELAEFNRLVLYGVAIFAGKDVIVGALIVFRLMFLSDDVKVTNTSHR